MHDENIYYNNKVSYTNIPLRGHSKSTTSTISVRLSMVFPLLTVFQATIICGFQSKFFEEAILQSTQQQQPENQVKFKSLLNITENTPCMYKPLAMKKVNINQKILIFSKEIIGSFAMWNVKP